MFSRGFRSACHDENGTKVDKNRKERSATKCVSWRKRAARAMLERVANATHVLKNKRLLWGAPLSSAEPYDWLVVC
jgi:hypothetical protein